MVIELSINKPTAKAAFAGLTFVVCALLVFAIIAKFIIGVLTDERTAADRDALAIAEGYFPDSAQLHSRLAEALERDNDLSGAESHAMVASRLSPYNFNFKILLASIYESSGKVDAAEQSLREGLALAPNKAEVHWQLANLLLREMKLDHAIEEFRAASAINKKLLPVSLNLIWRASGENVGAVEAIVNNDVQAHIILAQFLLKHSQTEDATAVFNGVDRRSRATSPEGQAFLTTLVASGQLEIARATWLAAVSDSSEPESLLWNGSFESSLTKELSQFDWLIRHSDYAKFKIVNGAAHSGNHSLRVDFEGRDTTWLDGDVRQLLAVRAGARYKLECYAKSEKLSTPEGPRLAVTNGAASANDEWIVTSEPVAVGQNGWQHLELEFTPPQTATGAAPALYVTLCRKPKYSYDEPTRGTVWFDDFTLTEVKAKP